MWDCGCPQFSRSGASHSRSAVTAMSDIVLFAIGLAVAVPAGTVVFALLYAAGIDEQEAKKSQAQREPDLLPRA